jgi:hypothetical protein
MCGWNKLKNKKCGEEKNKTSSRWMVDRTVGLYRSVLKNVRFMHSV